ncbi:unnamed protein product [Prunus armeniaca]
MLREVWIDEWYCKWISSSCKCIKQLQLSTFKFIGKVTINSSSLESFKLVSGIDEDISHLNITSEKLQDIDISWINVSSPSSTSLNILAPNLKDFKWEGDLMKTQNLGGLKSLGKVEIFLCSEVDDFVCVLELLCNICRAKVVILNEQTTKLVPWDERAEEEAAIVMKTKLLVLLSWRRRLHK